MKPARSLKARALQLLSQREQSRLELRRKLLACLKADEAKAKASAAATSATASERGGAEAEPSEPADLASQVDAVLDWLAAHQFASDERFAESRVHARSGRYGNLRIRQELKQHAVVLTPEATQALEESEQARAATVYGRRFSGPPETASERAKRARFLCARGFSSEVVRRVMRNADKPGGSGGSPP